MNNVEDRLQIACVQWFSLQYPTIAPLLHHSPNGGQRTIETGARFKRMGTRAGFPDLILLLPTLQHPYLCVELKTKDGRQSDSQKLYQKFIEKAGGRYELCRSFNQFKAVVEDYLK